MRSRTEVLGVITTLTAVGLIGGSAVGDVLYDNGPLVTNPGAGAGGADASAVQGSVGNTTLGLGHQLAGATDNRVADDFTVTDPNGWTISTITFFAYQTGSTTDSTITAVNLRIWDGPPGQASSSVVFGNTSTNVLQSTTWSGIYRTGQATLMATDRPIMADVVAVNTLLPQGNYWLDWQSAGSLASGPWAVPITVVDAAGTGNALQSVDGGTTYALATDGGSGAPLGMPFIIEGTGEGLSCPADTNGDGQVNVTDLINVISTWGTNGQGPGFDADVSPDGTVNVSDLIVVISGWGPCPAPTRACCLEGSCVELVELNCAVSGGLVQNAGVACNEVNCAPDSNDTCAGATALSFGVTVSGSTINSTPDPEALDCRDETGGPQAVTAPGNWYTVVGNGNTLTATMCSSPSPYDAKIFIYCGTSCGELFCLTSNDDGCAPGGPSLATWCSAVGQQYYIFVTGFGTGVGEYELTVNSGGSCSEPTPCLNDEDICEFALDLAVGQTVNVSNAGATIDGTAPDCGLGGQAGPGVWLRVVGNGTTYTVRLCNPLPISLNTRLSVYCGPCNNLQCANTEPNNNSGCAPFTEQVVWCTEAGREYYVLVSGNSATALGSVDVTLTSNNTPCNNPPCPIFLGDECANPIPLTLVLGQTTTDQRFISEGFTSVAADPNPELCAGSGGPFTKVASWWYEVTIPAGTASVLISACATDPAFDSVLGVYASCANLVEVDCDDDTCTAPAFGPFELLTTKLQPGQTYLLYVDVYSPSPGDGPWIIEVTPNP